MTRDRALDAVNYDSFKAFATSGAKTENDPDVMEQFVYHHFLEDDRPQSSSSAERKKTCLELYNRAVADAKIRSDHTFLGRIVDFLQADNNLMTQWVEWLDPEGGLEL